MRLVNEGFINSKQKVEIEITQGLPVSPILFLIYIRKLFYLVEARLSSVLCMSFVEDLAFVTSDLSINKVGTMIKKASKIAL